MKHESSPQQETFSGPEGHAERMRKFLDNESELLTRIAEGPRQNGRTHRKACAIAFATILAGTAAACSESEKDNDDKETSEWQVTILTPENETGDSAEKGYSAEEFKKRWEAGTYSDNSGIQSRLVQHYREQTERHERQKRNMRAAEQIAERMGIPLYRQEGNKGTTQVVRDQGIIVSINGNVVPETLRDAQKGRETDAGQTEFTDEKVMPPKELAPIVSGGDPLESEQY